MAGDGRALCCPWQLASFSTVLEDGFSTGGIHRGLIPRQQGFLWPSLPPTPPPCLSISAFIKGSSLISVIFHLLLSLQRCEVGFILKLASQVHVKYKEVREPVVCLAPSTVGRFTPGDYQMRALVSFPRELVCQHVWLEGACGSFLLSLLCSFILVTGVTV